MIKNLQKKMKMKLILIRSIIVLTHINYFISIFELKKINNEYENKNSKINYQTKTLENDEKILQNKINNKIQIKTNKQKPKEYNIFLIYSNSNSLHILFS